MSTTIFPVAVPAVAAEQDASPAAKTERVRARPDRSKPADAPQRIRLDYGRLGSARRDCEQKLLKNVSAVVQTKRHLWLASDEGATLQRLTWTDGRYAASRSFALDDYFALPAGPPPEIDLEGLAVSEDRLWVAGWHSRVRRPAAKGEGGETGDTEEAAALARLAKVRRRPRRYLLGCLQLSPDHSRIVSPRDGSAPCLKFDAQGNSLTRHLRADPHLAPFLGLPDKENGLDIEGLAVHQGRIFLGLRGPVLRGFAVVLEIQVTEKNGALRLDKIGARGRRYRKHLLDLGGLGIRDLAVDGDGLLILAGPTMGLAGPWSVVRWANAFRRDAEGPVEKRALKPMLPIAPRGGDHPEGITAFAHANGRRGWLLVYDHPARGRVTPAGVYAADFFEPRPKASRARPGAATLTKGERPRRIAAPSPVIADLFAAEPDVSSAEAPLKRAV